MSTPVKQTYNEIEELDIVACRIYSRNGDKLHEFECSNSAAVIDRLKDLHGMFHYIGRVVLWGANANELKANFKGCVKWEVNFTDDKSNDTKPVVQDSLAGRMKEMADMMLLMKTINGSNNNGGLSKEYIDLKIEMQAQAHKHELAMLKNQQENGTGKFMKEYGPLAPFAMKMMGWSPTEIKETMQLSMLGMPSNIQGPPVQTAEVNEIKNMTNEQKNAEIEKVWNEITAKVSADQMLQLLRIVNAQPALVDKVLQMKAAGMF